MKSPKAILYWALINTMIVNAVILKKGDTCQMAETATNGVCKHIRNCPDAQQAKRLRIRNLTICSYENNSPIVCCPLSLHESTTSSSPLPLHVQKCKEYSKYVFRNATILVPNYLGAVTRPLDLCGHIVVPLIFGGTPAAPREFPHSAALGYKYHNGSISWRCGGSLVSTRYVLTAAHCFIRSVIEQLSIVRLGDLILNSNVDQAEMIDVNIEKVILHPDYIATTRYNDIALLKMAHQVQLSPFVRPICLPSGDESPAKLLATGWGATELHATTSDALLKVVLDTYTNDECNNFFRYNLDRKLSKGIIATQYCAGSRNESRRDTCQGDSGGPLQAYDTNYYCMYEQIGITSFGIECGGRNTPAVYTRVNKYVDWISSIIWADGEDE